MENYNLHLYHLRLEKGLKPRAFAKFLGLGSFTYYLLENGYKKPSKKHIKLISEALNEDFSSYLEGEYSYPVPLDENQEGKFAKWFYHFIGKLSAKLIVAGVLLASLGVLGYGCYNYDLGTNRMDESFAQEYLDFKQAIVDKGTPTISLTESLFRSEIFYKDETKFYTIKADYKANTTTTLKNTATYYIDNYRMSFVTQFGEAPVVQVTYVDYEKNATYMVNYMEGLKDNYVYTGPVNGFENLNDEETAAVESDIQSKADVLLLEINTMFDKVIKDNLDIDYRFYEDLNRDFYQGNKKVTHLTLLGDFLILVGGISIAGCIFSLAFCFIYGRKKGEDPFYKKEYAVETLNRGTKAKKDFKFSPFIPETVFEIIGIILVFFGTLRVLYYFFTFLNVIKISGNDFTTIPNQFLSLFMLGMFLLYYIDFDIFLDDKRLFRNIVMYFIIFVIVYLFETYLMISLSTSDSLVLMELGANITPPNNFATITCYFLMMLFLFYTPKKIHTQKSLIIYRLLAFIPIVIIFVNTLIFNCANTIWGWNLPIWALYLFASERVQFSLLCVIYLLGLFFLKLFFEKKYGVEKTKILMNGNRFMFYKNIIGASIVFIIGLLEIILSNNPTAHTLGLGKYTYLIYLTPLLLFYHPHFGKRNKAVDYTTSVLYTLSISGAYLLLVVPMIIMLISSI